MFGPRIAHPNKLQIDELVELIWQHFKTEYKLPDSRAHDLESHLRHIESFKSNLDREAAAKEAEAAAVPRVQASSKRERSPDEDEIADVKGDGDITPVASEKSEDAVAATARRRGGRAAASCTPAARAACRDDPRRLAGPQAGDTRRRWERRVSRRSEPPLRPARAQPPPRGGSSPRAS